MLVPAANLTPFYLGLIITIISSSSQCYLPDRRLRFPPLLVLAGERGLHHLWHPWVRLLASPAGDVDDDILVEMMSILLMMVMMLVVVIVEVVLPPPPTSLEPALRFPCKSFFSRPAGRGHDGLGDDGDGGSC